MHHGPDYGFPLHDIRAQSRKVGGPPITIFYQTWVEITTIMSYHPFIPYSILDHIAISRIVSPGGDEMPGPGHPIIIQQTFSCRKYETLVQALAKCL